MKSLFVDNGFEILYATDQDGPIADGMYFTVANQNYSSGNKLLKDMMRQGLTAVPLGLFGGTHPEGLRICTSKIRMEDMGQLEKRLSFFK